MTSHQIAGHYNAVPNMDKQDRKASRIYYLRNFNNWIKSCLISEAVNLLKQNGCKDPTVLDLCCGKGGDLSKWKENGVKKVVMADIADVSLQTFRDRYEKLKHRNDGRIFEVEFVSIDLLKASLKPKLCNKDIVFDLVSCQFALHYSFDSVKKANQMLSNIANNLRPGGYFIGTLPDANRIVHLLRNGNGSFSNEICQIEYPDQTVNISEYQPALFGSKLMFNLDEVVNCPEYFAYFPLLCKMLENFDLELVYCKPFPEAIKYFLEKSTEESVHLLKRTSALEPYKPNYSLKGSKREYLEAESLYKEAIEKLKSEIMELEAKCT